MQSDIAAFQEDFSEIFCQMQSRVDSLLEKSTPSSWTNGNEGQTGKQQVMLANSPALCSLGFSWTWLRQTNKCMERQIQHLGDYHLFYETLHEYQQSLEVSLSESQRLFSAETFSGDKEEARRFFDHLQNLITLLLHWWHRIDALILKSRGVLPIPLRRKPVDMKRPGKVIIDFKDDCINLRANDDVFIVDNRDLKTWTIESVNGVSTRIPAICVTLSGPDPDAVEKAVAMRQELLRNWTVTLRELGQSLISYMLSVFRRLNKTEVSSLQEIATESKKEVLELLEIIESLLDKHWSSHAEFPELREKMQSCRASLAVYDEDDVIDDVTKIDINTIFLQMTPLVTGASNEDEPDNEGNIQRRILRLLLKKYQEFVKYWEVYKLMVENSNDPNYFWMMEEFQKLKIVNVSELFNFLANDDKEMWVEYIRRMLKQGHHQPQPLISTKVISRSQVRSSDWPEDSRKVILDAKNGKTFTEKSNPPRTGVPVKAEVVNLAEAPVTRTEWHSTSLDLQINGSEPPSPKKVVEEPPSPKKVVEEPPSPKKVVVEPPKVSTESGEVVTSRREVESRIVISGVCDTATGEILSLQDALERGLVDQASGSFLHREQGAWIPIPQAMSDGLILVETQEVDEGKEEEESYGLMTLRGAQNSSYVVTSVYDKESRSQMTPEEAQKQGLADEGLQSFKDTSTGNWLTLDEASERGIVSLDVQDSHVSFSDTYMIYSVVDVKNKAVVTFREAVAQGLLDGDVGCFVNSSTGEAVEITEAIKKGFLKAEKVKDPKKLSVDPRDRLVVKNIKSFKSKARSIMALKSALKK